MPIYQFDIEKKALLGVSTGEYWTNRYLCSAATLGEAVSFANGWVGVERAIHTPAVAFTKMNVRDILPDTDVYSTVPINQLGIYGSEAPTDLLPAMLVVRVDLGVLTGRPSRKFYHVMMGENSQSNGGWNPALLTQVQATIAGQLAITTDGFLCDPQGAPIITAAPKLEVTVHQFRRGSKKRNTPVLP